MAISVGYVGLIPSSYPINTVYLWTRGPEEAVLRVALKPGSGVGVEDLKERLAREAARRPASDWLRQKLRPRRCRPRRDRRRACRACSSPSSRPTSSTRS